ncbi:MAG TPA: hypothetical protein VKR21_10470 [Solirubrobacteraceae bacterium]|nr:hypothetical protein [Solirubrobacteraceae bacterium]
MRAEVELTPAPPILPAPGRTVPRRPLARPGGVDWFEASLLGIFALLSLWVMAVDLWQVVVHGRVWTGTDGIYIVDQMQYLAWIQSAAHHLLSSNLFVLRHTPSDYFMPAITISGGLTALGVAPWLSLLLWKPVAVLTTFLAIRAYAHRSLDGVWERRIALAFGLFFGSVTVIYGSLGTLGDLFPPFLSWGYTFGLMALAAMVFALLAYDRARSTGARRTAWAAALLGGLSSLLHPWQGEMLIIILVGSELAVWWSERRRPRLGLPLLALVGTALPLLYYLILAHTDLSWQLARVESKHSFSIFTILLAVLPLLAPALIAYRGRAASFLAVLTRVWPGAALAIYLVSASSVAATPLHAFEGITIPLAVLAIVGLRRLGFARLPARGAVAALAVVVFTVPGTIYQLRYAARTAAPNPGNPNFITRDEHHALHYLARDPVQGGVLTRFYLGAVVPAETGRRTFVGHCLWSEPGCAARAQLAQRVLDGAMPESTARTMVEQTGARFVLADCKTHSDLDRELAPLIESVRRFGCAAVYTLKPPSPPQGPLAESPRHAALRTSGRQRSRVQYG